LAALDFGWVKKMAGQLKSREEIDILSVDPLFIEKQRDKYASRGLAYIVLLNGIAALGLLVGIAHATLSAKYIAQLADAMMVFGVGVTAGLASIFLAYLRRTFLIEQSSRNLLRWLAIVAALIGAICFVVGLNMSRIAATSAAVSSTPPSATSQQGVSPPSNPNP
jgi:predicted aspartyl protease